jgi:pyruvate kinase|tara:strand:- start:478 stop:1443 length:966 start_codon:yes stop_codon:yes gene_type:complete
MNKKISIICTLGPSSLNKEFLNFAKNKVSLFRLNMSHLSLSQLQKSINFIRQYSKIPICVDTEGAQIRTKIKKNKFFKLNQKVLILKKGGNFNLYPETIFKKIEKEDILNVGFENLKLKVIKKNNKNLSCKTIASGKLENNKGVHLENRKIKLDFLTRKDLDAIKVAVKLNINNFALSFTNSANDIIKFNKLLKNKNKIFKIETKMAIKNFNSILKTGNNFLIDRGDLSKDVSIENIPFVQRKLFLLKNKYKNKKIFVATNLLESMMTNNYPTRGEANDIFNCLEMGSHGLVLAAETAIGKYPKEAVDFLKKMIQVFQKNK